MDSLRLIAILAVVLYHVEQQCTLKAIYAFPMKTWYLPVRRLLESGSRGVELFFVISGFVLGLPFARHALAGGPAVSLRRYYLRRLTRLEPPYLFSLLVFGTAIVLYERWTPLELVPHFIATALYVHELIYGRVSPINSVTWTLEIEVQFYLVAPLLALCFRIPRTLLRQGVMITAIASLIALSQYAVTSDFQGPSESWIYASVFIYLQYFLTGLLLSDVYLTLLPGWRSSMLWDLAGVLCGTLCLYLNTVWDQVLLPPLIFVSIIAAFRGVYISRLLRVKGLALVGGMCYSIYLWHFFIIAMVFRVTRHVQVGNDWLLNLLLQVLLLLPPVFAGSAGVYLLIERPCMDPDWPSKLLAKIKAAAGRSAAA